MFARPVLPVVLVLFGALFGATSAFAQPDPTPPPAQLGLTPSGGELQFGAVAIHFGGNPQQSITFSNESSSVVTPMAATVSGIDPSRFQIVYDGCANQMIWPGNSCSVEIRFQPELGEENAILSMELPGEGTLETPLSGTGITGTLSANPDSLKFSAIPYTRSNHEESQNETEQVNVEAQNAGVQVESVSIAGPDASSFSVQYGNCDGYQLPPSNWCNAGIRFQPLSPGEKHAELIVKSDAQNSPLVIPLEGEGLNGPKIDLSSNEALLGDVTVGTAAWHTFALTNGGDYPLFIQQSFTVSGTPQMFPLLSDTCTGQIIQPGASCVYTVGFQPATTGEKDASIIFITNASPQINVLGIDGVGVQPTAAPIMPAAALQVVPPAPAATPPVTQATAPTPKHDNPSLLTFEQASRVYSSIGNGAVETGVNAQCPAKVGVCQTDSFITARVLSHPSSTTSQNIERKTVLLGSHLAQLRGGERAVVRVPLSRGATGLLKRHGHLRVTIETVIHADGKIIAERTRTIELVAAKTTSPPCPRTPPAVGPFRGPPQEFASRVSVYRLPAWTSFLTCATRRWSSGPALGCAACETLAATA